MPPAPVQRPRPDGVLASAGKIASRRGDGTVQEDHVSAAQEFAKKSRFRELIRGSTPHSKYALSALAYLQQTQLQDAFSTGEIYEVYEGVCAVRGTDPLSHQRVLDLLKEWAFSDVTENQYTGGGKSEGSYREHSLLRDPEMVLDSVFVDSEQDEIMESVER
jgi:cell division control protein 6